MIEQGGEQDAGDNRQRPAKTGREDKRQQLRLIADFRQGDDAGGDEKGLH